MKMQKDSKIISSTGFPGKSEHLKQRPGKFKAKYMITKNGDLEVSTFDKRNQSSNLAVKSKTYKTQSQMKRSFGPQMQK